MNLLRAFLAWLISLFRPVKPRGAMLQTEEGGRVLDQDGEPIRIE